MGERSGDSSGGSFLPFVTSVTTDIYDRIDKLAKSLDTIKTLTEDTLVKINENLKSSSEAIDDLIQQGEMNKQMTLEAFADSMNTLAQEIRKIRNENIELLQNPKTQQMIDAVNITANKLEVSMYDIQIAFLINGIHALINATKSGKIIGIPVPVAGASAPNIPAAAASTQELAAPMPTLSGTSTSATEKDAQKSYFGKGVRKKTHDEIMEEKRKKERLFGTYLK
ncbi:MAG TPA: hypothetical protein VMV49_12050 [Candidatus Deferrimicrobium sp.]|nr:hypothetical protein [Candidatus Deferrimicrobium sp.]